jgi:hypothetical protein
VGSGIKTGEAGFYGAREGVALPLYEFDFNDFDFISIEEHQKKMLIGESHSRDIEGLSPEAHRRIMDFLRGAVYGWCITRKRDWFSLKDLFGGINYRWQGTPLEILHERRLSESSNQSAIKEGGGPGGGADSAGRDAGILLKRVLIEDGRRSFRTMKDGTTRKYCWTGDDRYM